jgi:hypothetical protein
MKPPLISAPTKVTPMTDLHPGDRIRIVSLGFDPGDEPYEVISHVADGHGFPCQVWIRHADGAPRFWAPIHTDRWEMVV